LSLQHVHATRQQGADATNGVWNSDAGVVVVVVVVVVVIVAIVAIVWHLRMEGVSAACCLKALLCPVWFYGRRNLIKQSFAVAIAGLA